jgi:Holliday junction DNA helicase RuvA
MIAYLKGPILQKSTGQVVLDVHGVGYGAFIPLSTYLRLGDVGGSCELHIYTHLTDNALALYGFSTEEERGLFLKLIGISGIGPKLALNVLSGIGPTELEEAVQNSDVARITLIPGIGKKLATRIALELQEKMEKKERVLGGAGGTQERQDLISTLMNLGFRRKEVEGVVDEAIRALKPQAGIENLLRECLRRLAKL